MNNYGNNLYYITLPFEDGSNAKLRVLIYPDREYGKYTGIELIDNYNGSLYKKDKNKTSLYDFYKR